MATTLVGLFDDRDTAHDAVQDLMAAGFGRDRISLVAADPTGEYRTYSEGNLANEGASTGLSSGALVGGLLGLLVGSGAIFFPPAGALVAGPLVGFITGAATGAATGGVVGGLIGLGISKEHATVYAESIRRGGTLVSITVDDSQTERVRDLLNRDGAIDIERRIAYYEEAGHQYRPSDPPLSEADIERERDLLKAYASDETTATGLGTGVGTGRIHNYAYADTPTGVPEQDRSER